jgi:uncharacterized membrane protein YebE (DUF533 family)
MNTVTKMAIGFAMAKGMDAMKKNGGVGNLVEGLSGGAAAPKQAGGMGGLSDIMGQLGGGAQPQSGGGLGGMLGKLTGGSQASTGGGIGDMLGKLTGGKQAPSGGGLGDILGQLAGGGGGAAAGGLGGLGALLGGLAGARGGSAGGGLEAMLNQDNPADEPDEDDVAKLMLRAMTQAARADGDIDPAEKESLIALLRSGDPENVEIVQDIMSQPVDAARLAADTPRGLETQVYSMSVNSITPDNQAEAQYLHTLAEGLGIKPETANEIHDSLGAPRLYR